MTRAPRTLLVATVASLALASACGDDDGQESDAEPSRQPVLEVGSDGGPTCLLVEEELAAEVEELPVVDCDIEHTHEIYATVEYRGRGVYPGIDFGTGGDHATRCPYPVAVREMPGIAIDTTPP